MNTTNEARAAARRILLVEDETIIAIAQKASLSRYGYQVETVGSGEEAVALIRVDPEIELILMDIDLGEGMDGAEAAREILEIRHLPIIFLTSHTEQEYVEKVKAITRYGYVIKNSGEFVLWDTIEVAFELYEANRQVEKQNQALARANVELAHANEELERFFTVNLDLLCIADEAGRFVKVNRAWEEILGHSREELEGASFMDFVHPEDRRATRAAMQTIAHGNNVMQFVNRYRSRDGSYRFIEWRSHPWGRLTYASARDITDHKRADEALHESEERYRKLFEEAPVGIFRTTSSGAVLQTNLAMARMMGFQTPEEAVCFYTDLAHQFYVDPSRRAQFLQLIREEGFVEDFELEAWRTDGGTVWISMNGRISHLETDGSFEMEGFCKDVTQRKHAEQHIDQLLNEKDLLRREMRHRIKNNMNTLSSLLRFQESRATSSEVAAALQDVHRRTRSMAVLYDKLFHTGQSTTMSMKLYLEALVDEIGDVLGAGSRVRVGRHIDDLLLDTRTLSAVGTIVNELLTNAFKHAFPGDADGEITVTACARDGRIVVETRDTGVGFEAEEVASREGSYGLGLVRLLARQLDASLRVDSRPGSGTLTRLVLRSGLEPRVH